MMRKRYIVLASLIAFVLIGVIIYISIPKKTQKIEREVFLPSILSDSLNREEEILNFYGKGNNYWVLYIPFSNDDVLDDSFNTFMAKLNNLHIKCILYITGDYDNAIAKIKTYNNSFTNDIKEIIVEELFIDGIDDSISRLNYKIELGNKNKINVHLLTNITSTNEEVLNKIIRKCNRIVFKIDTSDYLNEIKEEIVYCDEKQSKEISLMFCFNDSDFVISDKSDILAIIKNIRDKYNVVLFNWTFYTDNLNLLP